MQEVIQVNVLSIEDDVDNKIYELESLINTAGASTSFYVSQVVSKVNPRFYIGKGKVDEIKKLANDHDIKTVVFDVKLSPSQLYNLEEELNLQVIDWTTLILDIFAMRANTKESRQKIKLAQLKYRLPRINKYFSYLSRQAGGIGTRGPGETMLETDKRAIIRDIKFLEKSLKTAEKTKAINRNSRRSIINISLLGYTNAGKSTILNKMIDLFGKDKYVYSDDLLFATLDTSTRRLDFNNIKVTLTDTVGFIDNLSDELKDSFLTTLDEIKFADILLIVIDSSLDIDHQLETIEDSLSNIELGDKQIIYVFNKIDKLDSDIKVNLYKREHKRINISAKKDEDLIRLKELIVSVIEDNYNEVLLNIPYKDGAVVDYMMSNYDIIDKKYKEDGVLLKLKIDKKDLNKYEQYIQRV